MTSAVHESDLVGAKLSPLPPVKLARAVVAAVFIGLTGIGFIRVVSEQGEPVGIAVSFMCIAALLLLQLFWFNRPQDQLRSPLGYGVFGIQALLAYLPMLQFDDAWAAMPGFLAGSTLLVLPGALAWLGFGTVVVSMLILQAMFTGTVLSSVYTSISTIVTGFVVYGFTRLAGLIVEMHAAREEMAEMAVVRERLRFARDLHDLLGYSLSAITLKSELTHRLVTKNPTQAKDELVEILGIARQALADVRTVSSSYRELSIEDECRSARWVLSAADVEARMTLDHRELPVTVSTVLATVLREGITNVLRHSKAEWCEVTVHQQEHEVSIEIVNDGVRAAAKDTGPHGGGGLRNLSSRAAELGGTLAAEHRGDDEFGLKAAIPLHGTPAGTG